MLTPRARSMMDSLPGYYQGEPLIERIVQAWANSYDRIDALLDRLKVELQPGAATDELGLLAAWERILGLPTQPPGASVGQRQTKVTAALQAIGAASSAERMAALEVAIGSANFTVTRDLPNAFEDVLEIPLEPGSFDAGLVELIAQRMWPAHRQLVITDGGGFRLDLSGLDDDVL